MTKFRFCGRNSVALRASKPFTVLPMLLVGGLVIAADTGDAPESYGVASHEIVVPGPYLGDEPADDNSPLSSESALADDQDGLDDEGGVFAFPVLVQNGKAYDTNVFASNPLDTPVTLAAWVDFDGSGSFDSDEFAIAFVPAGAENDKYKMEWPSLEGVTTDFFGTTYARFRISTEVFSATDAATAAPDGEVEDYTVEVQQDSDGDELPNAVDPDNDNDGIPDNLEGTTVDTDNDGTVNSLDVDSDNDSIPDFIEAGANPLQPADTDGDGIPDFLDEDSDNDGTADKDEHAADADGDGIPDAIEGSEDSDADGIVNSEDLDADNDTIPDAIERGLAGNVIDTDGDGISDYLDLDSDNDGIFDIREANARELNVSEIDTNGDGAVDSGQLTGVNGLLDAAETVPDSGIPVFSVMDSDGDGIRDFRDLDSDNDSVSDLLETLGTDIDNNARVDSVLDNNMDGIADDVDVNQVNFGDVVDSDADGLADHRDADADGRDALSTAPTTDEDDAGQPETDGDGAEQGGSDEGSEESEDTSDSTTDNETSDETSDESPEAGGETSDNEPTDTGSQEGEGISDNTVDDELSDDGIAVGEDAVIQTGLGGGAGCSISAAAFSTGRDQTRTDILFPVLLISCLAVFFGRKRRDRLQNG